jgi:hypothetical protein
MVADIIEPAPVQGRSRRCNSLRLYSAQYSQLADTGAEHFGCRREWAGHSPRQFSPEAENPVAWYRHGVLPPA